MSQNPYQPTNWASSSSFIDADPWREDRERAPGFGARDIDYLVRQAFAQGCQDGVSGVQAKMAKAWDEGYRSGHTAGTLEARQEVIDWLRKNVWHKLRFLLERIERQEKAKRTTIRAERDFIGGLKGTIEQARDDVYSPLDADRR